MLERFLEEGLKGKSPATKKTYASALKQFEEWLVGSEAGFENFGRVDVQMYITGLNKNKAASTVNKTFNAIKSYCRWAGKDDCVKDIRIIKPVDLKKQAPRAMEEKEWRRVLRRVDKGNKRDMAIAVMLLNTGLRVGELVSLDQTDVVANEHRGYVRVVGKGNKERKIPLNAETRKALKEYRELRGDSNPALFVSNRGERMSIRSVQHVFKGLGVHPHLFRHTFIRQLVSQNVDLATIQELSGHSSADMVLRYSRPSEEDKEKATEKLFL